MSKNHTPNPPGSKGAEWQKRGREMVFPLSTTGVNVAPVERAIKATLGSAMVLRALQRPSLGNTLTGLVGAALIGEGVTGHSRLYQWLGINHADATPKPDAKSHRTPSGEQSSAQLLDNSLGARNASGEVCAFITIAKAPDEVYAAWKRPEVMSQIMNGDLRVEPQGDTLRWTLGSGSKTNSFESQITSDAPPKIAWETVGDASATPGALRMQGGEVRFVPAPANQGTEVSLRLRFAPPAPNGGIGASKMLKMLPNIAAGKALRNFKSLLESGEIPTLAGNVSARGEGDKF